MMRLTVIAAAVALVLAGCADSQTDEAPVAVKTTTRLTATPLPTEPPLPTPTQSSKRPPSETPSVAVTPTSTLVRTVEALRSVAEEAQLHLERGNELADQEQWQAAIDEYEKAIELDPNAAAYYNRGITYAELGRLELALADYDKAIELDPKDATSYINRGLGYAGLGDIDQRTMKSAGGL